MLTDLSIRDYAIVQRLDVELRGGMTCVTGETGAGKSILLDALGGLAVVLKGSRSRKQRRGWRTGYQVVSLLRNLPWATW